MRDRGWSFILKKLKIIPPQMNLQNSKAHEGTNTMKEPTKLTVESKFDSEEIKMSG